MQPPLLFVTGFGPFEEVQDNPSGRLALELARRPPEGVEICAGVLPVSFRRAPGAWDEILGGAGRSPRALLAMGVQPDPDFRLERLARMGTDARRPDVDGGVAQDAGYRVALDLENGLDLEPLMGAMRAAGAPAVRESGDAGGYLCERIHHRVLARARELGIPGLFLHTPPLEALDFESQFRAVRALALRLLEA